MDLDMNSIGERIKKRRKELHLTQVEIKQYVGISSGNLSDIENGNRAPALGTLYKLSQVLNCTIDWIVTGETPTSEKIALSDVGEEFLCTYMALSEDDQEEIMDLMQIKIRKYQKARKINTKLSKSKDTEGSNMVG